MQFAFWKKQSLIIKITCIITLFLIVPTGIICGVYYRSYCRSLISESDRNMSSLLQQEMSVIEKNLDLAEERMDQIAYDLELLYFTNSLSDISDREKSVFLQSLIAEWTNIQYVYPDLFQKLTLYTANEKLEGETAWRLQILPVGSFNEIVGGQNALSGEGVQYGEIRTVSADDETIVRSQNAVLPVYLPIRDLVTEQLCGVVELDLSLDRLTDLAYLETDTFGMAVFSKAGVLLAERQSSALASGDISLDPGGVIVYEKSGGRTRISLAQDERTGLLVGIEISERSVVANAGRMIYRVLLAAGIGILLVMAAIYLLVKGLLTRLLTLDQLMSQVEQGRYDIVLPEDPYQDEVSHLQRHFRSMLDALREEMETRILAERARKDAEFRALQAQINPHFLYNTLETMRMQCEMDQYYTIGNALAALARVLRYALRWDSYVVTMKDEWIYLQNYISIMALRLDDDFTFSLQLEAEAEKICVPKMFLQPLVENSFLHGFKGVPAPWHLEVKAAVSDGMLRVTIADNGSGLTSERQKELLEALEKRCEIEKEAGRYHSIGLINVRRRLDEAAPGSMLEIGNGENGGIFIVVAIPAAELR